jgi:hypothetical protein
VTERRFARTGVGLILATVLLGAFAGCGGPKQNQEIIPVDPNAPKIPVDPKASTYTLENEYENSRKGIGPGAGGRPD